MAGLRRSESALFLVLMQQSCFFCCFLLRWPMVGW